MEVFCFLGGLQLYLKQLTLNFNSLEFLTDALYSTFSYFLCFTSLDSGVRLRLQMRFVSHLAKRDPRFRVLSLCSWNIIVMLASLKIFIHLKYSLTGPHN